jgi:ATP-dependent Lon protease
MSQDTVFNEFASEVSPDVSDPESQPARDEQAEGPRDFAVLPLRDACVFPHMIVPFGVIREKSIRALQEAKRFGEPVMLISQRRPLDEDPDPENLYRVGTVGRVLQMLELPDGTLRIVVEGLSRARVRAFDMVAGYLRAMVEPLPEEARFRFAPKPSCAPSSASSRRRSASNATSRPRRSSPR